MQKIEVSPYSARAGMPREFTMGVAFTIANATMLIAFSALAYYVTKDEYVLDISRKR